MQPAVRQIVVGRRWNPTRLGAKLLGWWDAEDTATMVLNGSLVTTWVDKVGGYAPTQSISGSKPAFGATAFGGRPGIVFDGIDDCLILESVAFPTSTTPCDVWGLVDQQELGSVAGTLIVFAYGGNSAQTRRRLSRNTQTSTNRLAAGLGTGSSELVAIQDTEDFSGRHMVRGSYGSSSVFPEIDGVAAAATTGGDAATGSARTVIGRNTGSPPGAGFWKGSMNSIIITQPLAAEEAVSLRNYLNARRA